MSSHGIVSSKAEKTSAEREDEVAEAVTIAVPESSEGDCPPGITEVTSNSDGTSIDVHQLPVSDIYTVSMVIFTFLPYQTVKKLNHWSYRKKYIIS